MPGAEQRWVFLLRSRRHAAPRHRLASRQRLLEQAYDVAPPLPMRLDRRWRQAPVREDQLRPSPALVKFDGDDCRPVVRILRNPGERQQRRRLDGEVLVMVIDVAAVWPPMRQDVESAADPRVNRDGGVGSLSRSHPVRHALRIAPAHEIDRGHAGLAQFPCEPARLSRIC